MSPTQVLVVEDEGIVAKALQHDLERMGYEVPVVASSGEEAFARMNESYPDLLLMDIVLKGNLDGIEVTRQIRERFDVPVVYLTAYEDEQTLRRAQVTEPFGYLLKPYAERELHTTIEMALYKHRMERKVREAEQWLAATLNSIQDAVIATDARHGIRFTNPSAEQLTGWDRADAFGQALPEVLHLLPDSNPENGNPVSEPQRAEGEWRVADFTESRSAVLRARDGRQIPVECRVATIRNEQDQSTGFVWVFRDISEQLRTEQLRRQHEEQRRQAHAKEVSP